uniref:Cuticle protein CP14.6 n=1 Tax=Lepeophtheirus salmonis TaxID=72036 RepID=A0A0K2ULH1_LEPSM
MKYFALCTLVLCSAISIDAGVFSRRAGRNSPPISSYGAGQVGAASSFNQVTTSFGGSSFGGSAGGALSGPAAPVVAIISESNNAPGTLGDNSDFDNSFESENGIRQESSGSTVSIGEDSVVVMKGSYEYIGDDGQTYVVDWIADENGFQPSAPHLPKEVPIPFPEIAEAVEAQIAFAAQEDAAAGGSSFNGGFQGQSSGFQGQSSGFQGQSSGFQGQSSGFSGLGQQNFASSNQVQSSAPLTSYGG